MVIFVLVSAGSCPTFCGSRARKCVTYSTNSIYRKDDIIYQVEFESKIFRFI